jgi:hypothetical protein
LLRLWRHVWHARGRIPIALLQAVESSLEYADEIMQRATAALDNADRQPSAAGDACCAMAPGEPASTSAGRIVPRSLTAPTGTLLWHRSLAGAIQFDFRPNAIPSNPYVTASSQADQSTTTPVFVGLTPGQVGLYQINVTLPSTLPAVLSCSIALGIVSNLTIDIGSSTSGGLSFDGAPICIEAAQ